MNIFHVTLKLMIFQLISFSVRHYNPLKLLLTYWCRYFRLLISLLLARDAFVRTNRSAIAMMFVGPSVCPSETGVHFDHTVHFSADLSLWLDSPMSWAPW